MCARRLVTVRAPCTRLICWGTKRMLLPQAWHGPASPAQRRHRTLYTTSARPPLSRGGPHSRVTEVPFTLEIRFTGAEGGPGREAGIQCWSAGNGGGWGGWGRALGQQERSAQTQNWPEQRTAKTRAGIGVKCLAGKMVCIGMPNGRQQELVLVLGEAGGFGRRATLDVLTQMEGQTHISLAE